MPNHPNRSRRGNPAASPEPEQIRAAREAAGLTQRDAGARIFSGERSWQDWERGDKAGIEIGVFDMTRKDFEAVAAILNAQRAKHAESGWESYLAARAWCVCCDGLALDFADLFANDNPRFDRARFLQACDVGA